MVHHRPQRVALLVLGLSLATTSLRAGEARVRPAAGSTPPAAVTATARGSLEEIWATVQFWVEAWTAPAATSQRSGGRRGLGLLPTCDSGGSLDPHGGCGGRATARGRRHSRLLPAPDSGCSLDPDGRCHS